MEYVTLCKSPGDCRQFSRLVMGTDHLGETNWRGDGAPKKSEEEIFRILDEAARLGINFFDTSPIYVGGIENILGKWRASRQASNPDLKLNILSKGGFPADLSWSKRLEPGEYSPKLMDQLRRKGILTGTVSNTLTSAVDLQNVPPGTYASRLFGSQEQITRRISEELGHIVGNVTDVDICLMHRDDGDAVGFKAVERPQTEVKTIMKTLRESEFSKRCWGIGWSNWKTDRVNESLTLANDPSLIKPQFNSPYFSLFEMSPRTIHALGVQVTHEDMMDPGFQKGIHIMPYSPLGGFSILDQKDPIWKTARARAKKKYEEHDPYWQNVYPAIFTRENRARFDRVVAFTKRFNVIHCTDYTVDQMVNAYALAHPRLQNNFLAVGPTDVAQLHRTVGALALSKELTLEDLEYLHSGKRQPRTPESRKPRTPEPAQPASPALQ